MVVATEEKICEMRILLSAKELKWFNENYPEIKWGAGDTTIKWNANDPDEVEMARRAWGAYKKKHPKAQGFSVDKDDKKNTKVLKDFDPNAEKVILQDWLVKG